MIEFEIEGEYATKYVLPVSQINFEILDIDDAMPELINYYVMNMERCSMYFRISTSESVWVYYLLSLKGTK